MMNEGILSRMGRLIAGLANAAVDKAEGTNKVAVVEQALREIDAAADEARTDLGKSRAEEYRIQSRRTEITDDLAGLDAKDPACGLGRPERPRQGRRRSPDRSRSPDRRDRQGAGRCASADRRRPEGVAGRTRHTSRGGSPAGRFQTQRGPPLAGGSNGRQATQHGHRRRRSCRRRGLAHDRRPGGRTRNQCRARRARPAAP